MPELTGGWEDNLAEAPPRTEPAAPTGSWLDNLPDEHRPSFQGNPEQRFDAALRTTQLQGLRSAQEKMVGSEETRRSWLARRSLMGGSALLGHRQAQEYSAARKRLQEGTARGPDFQTIAGYEKTQQADEEENKTWGGTLLNTAARLPAMVGEAMAGGAATKAIGLGATASVPMFGARAAVQTVAMPSMYAEKWASDNMAAGRDPLDLKGLPAAYALGTLQTAVLNNLQPAAGMIPGLGGASVASRVGKYATMGGIGLVEQAAADAVGKWSGLSTNYGSIQDLLDRKYGDALRHATISAMTFAAFGAVHGEVEFHAERSQVMKAYQAKLQEMAGRGTSAQKAGETLNSGIDVLQKALVANPNLTKAEANKAVDKMPDGHARDFARTLADQLPEKAPEAPAPQAPPEAPQAQAPVPPAPESPQGQPAAGKDWQAVARSLGLKGGKTPEEAVANIKAVVGEKGFEQIAQAEVRPGAPRVIQPEKPVDQSGPGEIKSDLDTVTEALGRGKAVQEVPTAAEAPGQPTRPLPPLEDNYIKPLSHYADVMYRETNLDRVEDFLPNGQSYRDLPHGEAIFFSNKKELALGHKENHGVMMELDAQGLRGHVNLDKPGAIPAYEAGVAEFVVRHQGVREMKPLLRAVTVTPQAKGSRTRLQRFLDALVDQGWHKEEMPDGSVRYSRPDVPSGQRAAEQPPQPAGPKAPSPTAREPARMSRQELEEGIPQERRKKIAKAVSQSRATNAAEWDAHSQKAGIEEGWIGEKQKKGRSEKAAKNLTSQEMDYARELADEQGKLAQEREKAKAAPPTPEEAQQQAQEIKAGKGFGQPLSPGEKQGKPGGGEPGAEEQAQQSQQKQTALANAVAEAERQKAGREALQSAARKADPEVMAEADRKLAENPNAGFDLVKELKEKPRPTTDVENALLLHHKVQLGNEYDRLAMQYVQESYKESQARRAGAVDPEQAAKVVELDRRVQEIDSAQDEFDKIVRAVGTESARGFRWRAVLMQDDFSLNGMLRRAKVSKAGQELTPEETARVAELQKQFESLQARLDASKPGAETRVDLVRVKREWRQLQEGLRDATLSKPQKVWRAISGTLDLSRAVMTAFDLSAVLRQGGMLTFAHPLKALKAFPEMIRAFGSERAADRAMDEINQRPNSMLYRKAGLYLAEQDAPLSRQEEAFVGRWVRKIPGLAGSERAYNTFLNRMRADVFDTMTASLGKKGQVSQAEAAVLANFVNAASGRGALGALEKSAVPLSRLFFSPRFLASRLQVLSGQPLWSGTAETRMGIAKEYGRALLGLGAFYAIASLDDRNKLTFDPRSSDFGKVVIGNTHIDPLSGLAQVAVFGSRLLSGQTKSTTTGTVKDLRGEKRPQGGQDVSDVITRFVRSKLAPVPGAAINLLSGENVVGQPVTPLGQAGEMITPLALKDIYQSMQDLGATRGTAAGLLSILGMGTQVYEPYKGRTSEVQQYYARMNELEQARRSSPERKKGGRFAQEQEFQRYNNARDNMDRLSHLIQGDRWNGFRWIEGAKPPPERIADLRQKQTDLAKRALEVAKR